MNRDLSNFQQGSYAIGRSKFILGIWYFVCQPIVQSRYCPNAFRIILLRAFGSKLGKKVIIRDHVSIQFPWKLKVGHYSWIGTGVSFINHAQVDLGSNVCISQNAIICSGSHDYRSVGLNYSHKPIQINDGAWICLGARILAGVVVDENSVISAGEIISQSIPQNSLVQKGQIIPIEYTS